MARIAEGGGPTKTMPACGAGFGECGIFRKEAIAWMDRIGAAVTRGANDASDVEVAVARGRRPDRDCAVGNFHMQCIGVCFRIHGNCGDAHAPCRAGDAAGDLAAIGNQQGAKHVESSDIGITSGTRRTASRDRRIQRSR